MELEKGIVVRTIAGHDANRFMVVLKCDERYALIADGKTRTISSPKKKNLIHLRPTATVLSAEQLESDKLIRAALKQFDPTTTV